MTYQTFVGMIAGIFTSISMLPQFYKLVKTKDSKSISIGMLIVLLIGVSGWVYYGFLKEDIIIIITNAFAVLVNATTLIIAIKHRGS